jgi:MFS superfamily sulfate permease-like transporter
MNMATATGPGDVPAKSNALNGVSMVGDMTRDHDRANLAHAVIGCLALFLLWPLNVLLVGFFKNIKIHVVFSVLIMVFLVVSYVLGGITSAQYNRVSHSSPVSTSSY